MSERAASSVPNVAMVLPSNTLGGVEVGALRLSLALRDRRTFSPLAFVTEPEGPVGKMFSAEGFPTFQYKRAGPSYLHPRPYWSSVLELKRLFLENGIALIHCQDMHPGLQAPLAGKLAGIPSICHIRSNYGNFRSRYKLPLLCVDHFVFASRACWDNFDQIWKVAPERGSVLYDWVPEQVRKSGRDEIRRSLSIPEDAFVIGMVARISQPKDHALLLKASAELLARAPNVWVLFVGEARTEEQERELRSQVQSCGLAGRTTITGFREDVPDLLAAMDVHVLCSRRESFGLVIIEAMTAGVPVVATRVGGIPEIVEHGVTGLLHESGDAEGLREALAALAEDSSLRARLVRNASAIMLRRFSKQTALARVEALYKSLICW